jgi:hypothetical protein
MLKNPLCIIAMVLLATGAIAQRGFTVELLPTSIDISHRQFYIDSVIDNRVMRDDIGEAHVGMNNTTMPVVLSRSFAKTMKFYFDITTKRAEGLTPMIAVINELRVYEKVYSMKERGVADVNITFCVIDDGMLKIIAETFNRQESGGRDVTNAHGKRIDLAMRECLKQLQSTNWKENVGTPLVLGKEWKAIDDVHSILRADRKTYGSYYNFYDLRSNTPGDTERVIVPDGDPGELLMLRTGSSGKKIVEAYGFCDGENIFINTLFYNGYKVRGVFAKVEVIGPYMAWVDDYRSGGQAGLSAGSGLLGIAIPSSDRTGIVLDLRTGLFIPLRPETMSKILGPEPRLLQEYLKGRVRDPQTQLSFIKRFNELHPDL